MAVAAQAARAFLTGLLFGHFFFHKVEVKLTDFGGTLFEVDSAAGREVAYLCCGEIDLDAYLVLIAEVSVNVGCRYLTCGDSLDGGSRTGNAVAACEYTGTSTATVQTAQAYSER